MVYKKHGFNLHGFKINPITPGGTSKILNIPDGLVYTMVHHMKSPESDNFHHTQHSQPSLHQSLPRAFHDVQSSSGHVC